MNYKHLHYFMQVAKSGSVTRASEQLHLTPQTISGQIQLLEEAMGSALFAKSGRSLVLTDAGRLVLGYAEEIFSMGAELSEAVREHKAKGRLLEFKVGVVDAVPKAIAYRLLEPATQLPERVRIVCREGKLEGLLAALAMHRLDLVISDTPMPTSISVKAFNHQLGASGVSFFAAPALVETFEGPFPRCLDGARMLMPGDDSAVGRRLRAWFQERSLQPLVVGEFDDSALAKEFGRRGAGVFVAPTVLAKEIERQFGVKDVGAAAEVLAEFFAISVERRVTHPCVVAITQAARNELFAPPANARRTRRLASL
ncbi:MAG: transcriptional activator NhaR [Hydrogenophaga sp.]|uniref:transcriptional activator NhaR n=1 Tax=Hydrogenophaga sp. TaxID=1904254 RepID=UPI002752EF4D|nr:transcriptional activator NhaR [Hydrogenophaga sp.]MDP3251566.1 transcriptional activator NhaR [Hydrogenophaga sp.]MDP3811651.1 transcriptional activator NhaR [Hydrogenophaga sp.]MDZ4100143.1 transcriptional activator NhaR [Hydrogenophaga sp.]